MTFHPEERSQPAGLSGRVRMGARQGFRTALVAAFCYWFTRRLGLREGYWAAISAIVVMQSEFADTVSLSRDRLIGTSIGGLLGWACATVWNGHVLVYAAGVFLCMLVAWILNLGTAARITGVTLSIITLVAHTTSNGLAALHRFYEVSLGVVVALAFTLIEVRVSDLIRGRSKPAVTP